jgi:hypothetical protein
VNDSGKITIHGKIYETVALRVKRFWEANPAWSLQTEIVERTEEVVVVKAFLMDESRAVRATGHAEEFRASSQINKTSALENAETSAIGRALAAMGLGGTEFATADEVANAIHQQKTGVHKPVDGAFESLSKDRQKVIADTAIMVVDALNENRDFDAYGLCESVNDADAKVALWAHFDSKQRRRIKEASTKEKANAS